MMQRDSSEPLGDRLIETLTMVFEACNLYTYSVSYNGTLFALVPIPWCVHDSTICHSLLLTE